MFSAVKKEQSNNSNNETEIQYHQQHLCTSVSYTHLTLPTTPYV